MQAGLGRLTHTRGPRAGSPRAPGDGLRKRAAGHQVPSPGQPPVRTRARPSVCPRQTGWLRSRGPARGVGSRLQLGPGTPERQSPDVPLGAEGQTGCATDKLTAVLGGI